jgi:hypothetical protein
MFQIPCKHVFCLTCAKKEEKQCPRCSEKVSRVEQTGLGTVFMCTHGGSRYGNNGCRRTYLSQRDLQVGHKPSNIYFVHNVVFKSREFWPRKIADFIVAKYFLNLKHKCAAMK